MDSIRNYIGPYLSHNDIYYLIGIESSGEKLCEIAAIAVELLGAPKEISEKAKESFIRILIKIRNEAAANAADI